jgi:ferritin-like metal-binding protein YciE
MAFGFKRPPPFSRYTRTGAIFMDNLKQLFEETLKDVYFAEKQIIKALPKMAKKTKSPELKQAFEEHAEQTKGQVERLDQIFKLLGKKASGKECPALMGLVEEAEEIMSDTKDADVLNAGLIGCAQAVEHYEIARYGTLSNWAAQLDMPEAVKLLEATLAEEKAADQALTKLAMSGINAEADHEDDEESKGKAPVAAKSKAPAKTAPKAAPAPAAKVAPAAPAKSAPAAKAAPVAAAKAAPAPAAKAAPAPAPAAKAAPAPAPIAAAKPKQPVAAPVKVAAAAKNGVAKAPAVKKK